MTSVHTYLVIIRDADPYENANSRILLTFLAKSQFGVDRVRSNMFRRLRKTNKLNNKNIPILYYSIYNKDTHELEALGHFPNPWHRRMQKC